MPNLDLQVSVLGAEGGHHRITVSSGSYVAIFDRHEVNDFTQLSDQAFRNLAINWLRLNRDDINGKTRDGVRTQLNGKQIGERAATPR